MFLIVENISNFVKRIEIDKRIWSLTNYIIICMALLLHLFHVVLSRSFFRIVLFDSTYSSNSIPLSIIMTWIFQEEKFDAPSYLSSNLMWLTILILKEKFKIQNGKVWNYIYDFWIKFLSEWLWYHLSFIGSLIEII